LKKSHKSLYITTTIFLAIITIIEIRISHWYITKFYQIGLLVSLAILKMASVAYVFMHLYFEKKLLRKILFVPIPLLIYFLLGLVHEAKFEWMIQ